MRQLLKLATAILVISIVLFYVAALVSMVKSTMPIDPVTISWSDGEENASVVGTSTLSDTVAYQFQRKDFYSDNRYWVFYHDGDNFGYSSYASGTWLSFTAIGPADQYDHMNETYSNEGFEASIWFDGTYVHYARVYHETLYYRRGNPESNGTITWSAGEQIVDTDWDMPMITVASDNRVWIVGRKNFGYYAYAIKNNNTDGTWSTASGFPYPLIESHNYWIVSAAPLAEYGSVYIVCSLSANWHIQGFLYDGSWHNEGDIAPEYPDVRHSVVAVENDVYLAYYANYYWGDGENGIYLYKRTFGGGWENKGLIVSSPFMAAPSLTIIGENLLCMWDNDNTFRYVMYSTVGGNRGNPVDVWTENEGIPSDAYYSTFYQSQNNSVGLVWSAGTTSPHDVKFITFVPSEAPPIPNYPPNQPNQLKLDNQASPARAKSLTPTFAFRYTDNDGDNMTAFQIQIGTDNVITDSINNMWDYEENRIAENGGIVSINYGESNANGINLTGPIALGRGTWYYWHVRTTDNSDGTSSTDWGDWNGYVVGTEWAAESFFTNQLPLCSITASNGTPQTGDSVQFYSNASDPDNDNLTYAWDFGDSSTSDQANPTHAYSSSGSKTVTLIVNDGYENSVQDTTTIIVQEAGGGGGGPSWVPPAINKIVKPYTNLLFRSWFKIGFFSFNLFWLLLLIIILAYLYEKKPKGVMWSAILILGFLVVFGAGLGIL